MHSNAFIDYIFNLMIKPTDCLMSSFKLVFVSSFVYMFMFNKIKNNLILNASVRFSRFENANNLS